MPAFLHRFFSFLSFFFYLPLPSSTTFFFCHLLLLYLSSFSLCSRIDLSERSINPSAIYAIAAGSIFAWIFLTRTLSIRIDWINLFSVLASRHLTLPFVVLRHQFWGPWPRASVHLHTSYAAVNVFLVLFSIDSLTGAGRRAGGLALINLIFPLSATHLSYLADLLGIAWRSCRRIHRATGWMAISLLSISRYRGD